MERHLHIITHDVPWPADYGGVMDLFYKIKALHRSGVKIHLHCFVNKRQPQQELDQYCHKVYYYKRRAHLGSFSFRLPLIVNSRRNNELIRNLDKDNHPILLEGIHCSYYLHAGKLNNRVVLLRLHNAEFEYYRNLAVHEKDPIKKLYFLHESALLKNYEAQLAGKVKILAVSQRDVEAYRDQFNAADIGHLPVFLPYTIAAGKEGKGCFCLYHGNLSINENEAAAIWLMQNVFNNLDIPFVIAGKNPSQKLSYMAHENQQTCLVENPTDKELQDMISKAQINILPSFNSTGVKLKLLNAVFNGRHCLVNKAGVEGSGLNRVCQVAEDADEFKTAISYLYNIPFTAEDNEERQHILGELYCNQKNVEKIMEFFWSGQERMY
jgi:glycosyltransferase involved in cell wall biosynthesis